MLVEEDSQGVAAPSGKGLTLPSCQEQTLVLDCSGPMERERVASSAASSAGCAAAPVLVRTTTKRGLLGCSLRSCRMRWPLGSLQPPRRSMHGRADESAMGRRTEHPHSAGDRVEDRAGDLPLRHIWVTMVEEARDDMTWEDKERPGAWASSARVG